MHEDMQRYFLEAAVSRRGCLPFGVGPAILNGMERHFRTSEALAITASAYKPSSFHNANRAPW
jgi:hypothetical protein